MQALEIISLDKSTALNESETDLDDEDDELIEPEGDFEEGTVKWFNPDKGYGFITRGEDTQDVFIHVKTLRRAQLKVLIPGQSVKVRIGNGSKGPQVAIIELIS